MRLIDGVQDRRVAAEHELFNFGESLRRLELVMRTQEKHINALTVQLRDTRLANRHLAAAQQHTSSSNQQAEPTNQHGGSVELSPPTDTPCSQTECSRRRRLLRAIKEKVAEYSTLIEEKRAAEERRRKGKKRASTDMKTTPAEMTAENERLRRENVAYETYIAGVHEAYRLHFSPSA